MALMPVIWPGRETGYGLKAICVIPGNPAVGKDSHQGIVLLSSEETGQPLADAERVGGHRDQDRGRLRGRHPGAGPAGRRRAGDRRHRRAGQVAPDGDRRDPAADRDPGRGPRPRSGFAAFAAALPGHAGVPVRACASAREAVAGRDIVVTATSSAEPVVRREWLAPGATSTRWAPASPRTRELDTATVAGAALFADSRESARTSRATTCCRSPRARSRRTTSAPRSARCWPARPAGRDERGGDHGLRVARPRDRGPGRGGARGPARRRTRGWPPGALLTC